MYRCKMSRSAVSLFLNLKSPLNKLTTVNTSPKNPFFILNRDEFIISNKKRSFSTTQPKNAIPPLIWLIFKPITKLGAMIAGR